MFPHCVSDASHVSNAPYVFDPPNLPLVDSILATSQPDSTFDPTPSTSNTSHCDYQPDVSLPSALDLVVPPSPPSLDQSLLISSSFSLPALRRSTRTHHPPSYLADYSCKAVSTKPASGLPYDISNVLSYSHLGPQFASFVMTVSSVPSELVLFSQAVQFPEWKVAMDKEIAALELNNTWKLTLLPAGKSPIGCKWVYTVKYHSDGSIERYKACLVAKGFTQKLGLDYS